MLRNDYTKDIEKLSELYAYEQKHEELLNTIPLGYLPLKISQHIIAIHEYHVGIVPPVILLRGQLEFYIKKRTPNNLKHLETSLSVVLNESKYNLQNKSIGTYILPNIIYLLMRDIYLLNDRPLIQLMQKHFHTPPVRLFKGHPIPDCVMEYENWKNSIVNHFIKKNSGNYINKILAIQHHFRNKIRKKNEIERIKLLYKKYLAEHKLTAEEMMEDASTPYQPHCHAQLVNRLKNAAKWVAQHRPAFTTVKHITHQEALQSIFDDGLVGQLNLRNRFYKFRNAAMGDADILNGDANVACLGPQKIDPRADGNIVITFNLKKLTKNKNIPAFFKMRDLEFSPQRLDNEPIRKVRLGKETIYFDNTPFISAYDGFTLQSKFFYYTQPNKERSHHSEIPKPSLISYDINNIHEIAIMNFFRFIDGLSPYEYKTLPNWAPNTHQYKYKSFNSNPDRKLIDNLYKKIYALSDKELAIFMMDVEKNITDTAEFNLYGWHLIDFSTIENIYVKDKQYTLDMVHFISSLRLGNINELRIAREMIPELFQSYRFLDYLLSSTQNDNSRYYLDDLRKQCETPSWIEYKPLVVPEGFIIDWKVDLEYKPVPVKKSDETKSHPEEFPFKPQSNASLYLKICMGVLMMGGAVALMLTMNFTASASLFAVAISFFGWGYKEPKKSFFDEIPKDLHAPRLKAH